MSIRLELDLVLYNHNDTIKKLQAQGEAKRFLEALRRAALKSGNAVLSMAAMYAIADAIELQGDVPGAIEMLNEAGGWSRSGSGYGSLSGPNQGLDHS